MRKVIIDTDTATDDAVALIMALKENEIDIKAVTTAAGNISVDKATRNALMTIETADGTKPPVYIGSPSPLFRSPLDASIVHGSDGMGDADLIHPSLCAEKENAVDKIIDLVNTYPDEIEIISLAPVTNIALAMMKAPHIMKKVKCIYSMGTAGFGRGNTTPLAEFNVYADAEAYKKMIEFGVPVKIIPLDICGKASALQKHELELLRGCQSKISKYVLSATNVLLKYNMKYFNEYMLDLPDAVAMGIFLWEDEIVLDKKQCSLYVCTKEEAAYGVVIIDDGSIPGYSGCTRNIEVFTKIDNDLFKKKLLGILMS